MKQGLLIISVVAMLFGAGAAKADKLTAIQQDQLVRHVMNESNYGDVTVEWVADANLAGTLMKADPSSPLLVPGINPDGSMSLSTATAFVANLNFRRYLNNTGWRLPTTYSEDLSCSFIASKTETTFGYACAMPHFMPNPRQPLIELNPSYVFSELAALFNALGGQSHASIKAIHNDNFSLFKNVKAYLYWSQTAQTNNFAFGNDFWFQEGFQGTENQYDSMYVWPVRTVSVASTVPAASPPMLAACATGVDTSNYAACAKAHDLVVLPGLGLPANTILPPPANTLQTSSDGKLIYDPTTQVTYLADANLARTLLELKANSIPFKPPPAETQYLVGKINANGSMNQAVLQEFLDALNAKSGSGISSPYLHINTWNTPAIAANGYNLNCSIQTGQAASYGYNCDGTASQLGELFYDQLGGVAGDRVKNPKTASGRLFKNLQADYYWQCQPANSYPSKPCTHGVGSVIPSFSFRSGYQGLQSDVNELFVILVTPNNAIPAYEASLR